MYTYNIVHISYSTYWYICYLPPRWIRKNPMVSCMQVAAPLSPGIFLSSHGGIKSCLGQRCTKVGSPKERPSYDERETVQVKKASIQFEATTVPFGRKTSGDLFLFWKPWKFVYFVAVWSCLDWPRYVLGGCFTPSKIPALRVWHSRSRTSAALSNAYHLATWSLVHVGCKPIDATVFFKELLPWFPSTFEERAFLTWKSRCSGNWHLAKLKNNHEDHPLSNHQMGTRDGLFVG